MVEFNSPEHLEKAANHPWLKKLVNHIMVEGKKSTAERIFSQSLQVIAQRTNQNPYELVINAIDAVRPYVEVKSIRIAGSTYMVPMEINPKRQLSLALRWIAESSRNRKELTMYQKLASELIDAYNRTGGALKKKEELHKMAEANRAFAHYRW